MSIQETTIVALLEKCEELKAKLQDSEAAIREYAEITDGLRAEVARLREELGQHCNVQLVNANARLTNKIAEVDLQSVLAYDAGKREATEAALRWAFYHEYPDGGHTESSFVAGRLAALLGEKLDA